MKTRTFGAPQPTEAPKRGGGRLEPPGLPLVRPTLGAAGGGAAVAPEPRPDAKLESPDSNQPPISAQPDASTADLLDYDADWSGDRRVRALIPLALIDDSPYQPRLIYDESKLNDLAQSIAKDGLEQELQVRIMPNGRFELLGGHRRKRSCQMAGWTTAPSMVRKCSDADAERAVLLQADSGVDLCDFERALLYKSTIDHGLVKLQVEVANMYGKTPARISQCLAMLKLPEGVLRFLRNRPRLLSHRGAAQLLKLQDEFPTTDATAFGEVVVDALRRTVDSKGAEESDDQAIVAYARAKLTGGAKTNESRDTTTVVTTAKGTPLYRLTTKGSRLTIAALTKESVPEAVLAKIRDLLKDISAE